MTLEERGTKRARKDEAVIPEKSPNDKKEYRFIRLESGLQVMLVSSADKEKQQAAAAVAVGVGSFSDPACRCEGLAHYLEHMLFMGSGKYPGENEMEEFLSQNGGCSNAFTECEHTCYYLEVNKHKLSVALDMLAQFFVDPLLAKSASEREIKAIHSEFRLAVRSDCTRRNQLLAHQAPEGHPYRTFGWGNLASLRDEPRQKGVDINAELRSFYNTYYHARDCRLCVFGVEPLNSLEAAVRAAFDVLPVRGPSVDPAERFTGVGMPLNAESPCLLRVRPIRDMHELTLTWQLPPLLHLYRSKPDHYLCHLLGHEAQGSIAAYLKREGLATEVCSGVDHEDGFDNSSICALYGTTVTLTVAGLARWPEVVAAVIAYVDLLRRAGPQRWAWEELRDTADMNWKFLEEQNPVDYVQNLAVHMLPSFQVAPVDLPKRFYIEADWVPEHISELLSLMTLERCFITIASSAYGRATERQQAGPRRCTSGVNGNGCRDGGIADAKGARGMDNATDKDSNSCEEAGEMDDKEPEEEEEAEEEEKEVEEEEDDTLIETQQSRNSATAEPKSTMVGRGMPTSIASDPFFKGGFPEVEPRFGTEFWKEPLPVTVIATARQPPDGALNLPERNPFIATNFNLVEVAEDRPAAAYPEVLASDGAETNSMAVLEEGARRFPELPRPPRPVPRLLREGLHHTWYARTAFADPKVQISLGCLLSVHAVTSDTIDSSVSTTGAEEVATSLPASLEAMGAEEATAVGVAASPSALVTATAIAEAPNIAQTAALSAFMVAAINDQLNETVYMAEMAGLSCSVGSRDYGLDVHVGGLHHKLPNLLQAVLDQVFAFGSAERWKAMLADDAFVRRVEAQREELLRGYRNAYMKPGDHCFALRLALLMPGEVLSTSKADSLASVSLEELSAWSVNALQGFSVDMLVQGNMAPADVHCVADDVASRLLRCHGSMGQISKVSPRRQLRRVVRLPLGTTAHVVPSMDNGNKNCCVEIYFQWQPRDLDRLAALELIEQIMSEPLYDELRTKRQLGYDVSCGSRESAGILGFFISIQSCTAEPVEILRQIEVFLEGFRDKLETIGEEKLWDHRCALAASKLEPCRSLDSAQSDVWSEIMDRLHTIEAAEYVFDRPIREAAHLRAIGRTDLILAWDAFVKRGVRRRALIAVVIGGRHRSNVCGTKEALANLYASDGYQFVDGLTHWHAEADFYPPVTT
eukprot:TRINITY_DN27205_c0_g1_i1.p1 TRINITY_DN27205_c0_g1~~TRINITY_DN27205_c0_g1_i1.p1  ORF type:complete len:1209 (+),score=189.92 TRINITY_DN27205_c0_g1_i1:56-3682(+)